MFDYQQTFRLTSPFQISLKLTVQSHGWVDLVPWEWDQSLNELSRYDALGSNVEAMIKLTQESPKSILVTVDSNEPVTDLSSAKNLVTRWLSIDWSPCNAISIAEQLDTRIFELLKMGGGRMLRGSTFYEDFVKTICTIQISWAGTRRMLIALMDLSDTRFLPTPKEILRIGEQNLRQRAKLGFRAATLINSTDKLLSQGFIDPYGNCPSGSISKEILIGLKGIGPYSADHMGVLQQDFSNIPVDSAVASYCLETYGINRDEIASFFNGWGTYRFLGYRLDRIARRLENELPN